ncbi:6479_t:CDS:1, partial [Gigaspora margarita]
MNQQRVKNNDRLNEDLIVNATSKNLPEENQNRTSVNGPVPVLDMNNNQNPEPLHI